MFELQSFSSFEQFASAMGHSQLRLTALGREQKPWAMRSFTLGGIAVRIARDGGPCHFEAALDAEGLGLLVCREAVGKVIGNGTPFGHDSVMLIPGRIEVESTSLDTVVWISAFIPHAHLWAQCIDDSHRVPCSVVGPETGGCTEVCSVLEKIVRAAMDGAFEANPFGQQEAAQQIVAAARRMVFATIQPATPRAGRHRVSRQHILLSVRNFIEQHEGQPVAVSDLATAVGVSERTLNNVFREQFGMGPKRFLRLRLLNLARSDLRRADPENTSVSDVAARLGIWEWGRFSRDYRSLFGELPSHTLRGTLFSASSRIQALKHL